ncbi:MAG: alpha-galactosidase [Candidatus Aminicenantes bacterium]|nr:alpha-galactosidase [Candidatus Aminicenantes bacterium]
MRIFGQPLKPGRYRFEAGQGRLEAEVVQTRGGFEVRGRACGRLGRIEVLRAPAPPALLMNNWQSWGPMQKVASDARFPELEKIYAAYSPYVFSLVPDDLRRGLVSDSWVAWEDGLLGFLSSRVAHPFFTVQGGDLIAWLDFFETTFDEVVPIEPLIVLGGRPVEELLAAYGKLLRRENRVRLSRWNPVGWCSWYQYFGRLTWGDILKNLDLAQADPDFPFEVFQVDDGYERDIGDWLEGEDGYPALPEMAAAVRGRGFVPGIWTAPFSAAETSGLAARHPGWMVAEASGPKLCYRGWGKNVFALDTTRPEVQAWLFDVFRGLKKAGFDYFKIDFLFAAAMAGSRLRNLTPIQAYRDGLRVIRRAVGRSFVLGCGAPLLASAGLVDGMRVGEDTAPYWKTKDSPFEGPNAYFALKNALHRQFLHRSLWLNDPDCVLLRSREVELTAAEREMYALASGAMDNMILVSDDLSLVDAAGKETLRRALGLRGGRSVVRRLWEADDLYLIESQRGRAGNVSLAVNLGDTTRSAEGREIPPRSAVQFGGR